MSRRFSDDYHDYVFRDGQFIGDFDNMYRYSKVVPWEQDARSEHWYTQVGMLMLRERAPYDWILEIGCGLGYVAAQLKDLARVGVDAFDISEVAVQEAAKRHSGISFSIADIASDGFRPQRAYDLVVIGDLFWYLVARLDVAIRNIDACVRPGGVLYIRQSFPALDGPYLGKERIPGPDALIECFAGYEPIYTARLRNHELAADGPILHLLARKPT